MSGGQRQQIAIARAIAWADKVVFLDEPTAALGVVQTQNVLETIKRVRDRGIAVVLISHSMPQVLEVADRVQVMRLGRRVATYRGEGHQRGATGRCHDRRPGHQPRCGMTTSVGHGAASRSRRGRDPVRPSTSGCGEMQAVWILGVLVVIVAFFAVDGGRASSSRPATSP